ncbi:hypothetical protein Ancab_016306, partial [Ancistrocladus abbreviatus]
SLRFEHVANVINLPRSNNITLDNLSITATWNCSNTYGIHGGDFTNIKIMSSTIGADDDCASIGPSSFNISVFNTTDDRGYGI